MKFVGVCYDSGGWGGDLTGLLVVEEADGWKVAGSHISSSEWWAKTDIQGHFDRRLLRQLVSEADTYEWLGKLDIPAIEERFGWQKPAGEVEVS